MQLYRMFLLTTKEASDTSASWSLAGFDTNAHTFYSLCQRIDPAYADGSTFQFWVDVGNGHSFLVPSFLFSFVITFDEDPSSIFCWNDIVSPRTQGLIVCAFQYVMMQGTILYFASYIYSKKWVGVSAAGKLFVIVANGIWLVFPTICILAAYQAVQVNSWQCLRAA